MGILQFILIAVVVGVVVFLVNTYLPIPAPIKKIILWAAVIVLVLILCAALGLFGHDIAIPRLR